MKLYRRYNVQANPEDVGLKQTRYGWCSQQRGFALIATISVMVLLVMVALAISTLATLEARASRQSNALDEARANARMALMLAIGELQKHSGPDQSVTAPAGSLSVQGFAGIDVNHTKSRYLAVYNRRNQDNPDQELDGGKWSQSRKDFFRRWMVSGKSSDVEDIGYVGSPLSPGANTVKMSSRYTDPSFEVHVPTGVSETRGRSHRFAWWVDGLGTKASMALAGETDPALKMIVPDRFAIQQGSPDLAWFPGRGNESKLEKILSMQTADILGGAAGAATKHESWMTKQHLMVLADPKRSGLKGDLTSALGDSRANMEQVLGQRMFPPVSGNGGSAGNADPGGPYWAQAQDYYNMDGSGKLVVQPQKKDQMGVFPVIASFMEVFGLSNTIGYAPDATPHPTLPAWHYNDRLNQPGVKRPVYVMTAHMTPVVKLWNPYNKPLQLTGYTLVVGNNNSQYGNLSRGTYDDVILWGRGGGANRSIDARLPKSMRYEHRYYIPEVSFAPGEVKIFALHENRYLDLEGNYTPWNRAAGVLGKKTNVVQEGWILCDLTEGGFRGFSLWDMHFTKPEIYKENKNKLNWQGGRGIGGYGGSDAGDAQILDSNNPSGLNFILKPHKFVTWNIKLYKGRVKEDVTTSSDVPLINIKNINTDVTGYKKEYISFGSNPNPATSPFFVTQGALNSIWARRISLRHLINDGDDNHDLYNATAHGTKDVKWLANYNPRSATVGCWPKAYRRTVQEPGDAGYFLEPKQQMMVNGQANGNEGFGLGTTGNYLTGLTEETIGVQQLLWEPFTGYSDVGGPTSCILFDVPQGSDPAGEFFSVGQLRHANLWIENGNYDNVLLNGHGDEDWFADSMHPAYPIGNSYADPRLRLNENKGLYKKISVADIQGQYASTWYDLSWYLNDHLWDRYYFSAKKQSSAEGSHNPRLVAYGKKALGAGKDGYRNNAGRQLVAGAFNVNSVSKEAWKAFLASLIGTGDDPSGTPYVRYRAAVGGKVTGGTSEDDPNVYLGYREISSSELDELVEHVVAEVKKRGPFMSLGDFVNRAAFDGAPGEYQLVGALQAAIDQTKINQRFTGVGKSIDAALPSTLYEREAYAGDISAGVPGYLTQGDILSRMGHLMTVRSDTFKVRAYGESVDKNGRVLARVWCEAVVQRTPDYVDGNDDPTEPAWNDDGTANTNISRINRTYGRKFVITSFRWIPQSEIDS